MVVVNEVRVELVGLRAQESIKAVETTPQRPAVVRTGGSAFFHGDKVPLADGEADIAFFVQDFG